MWSTFPVRYSVGSLLMLTFLVTLTLDICRWFDWETRGVFLLLGPWFTTAFVGGWLAARFTGAVGSSLIPAAAFLAFNYMFWYWHQVALALARDAKTMLAAVLQRMLDADKLGMFDGLALAFAGMIAIAAYKRDQRLVVLVGMICCSAWTIIMAIGCVAACGSLE